MKKRLISIFLIVSIIISIFAVSAVSTSAFSKYTSAPKLVSVLPYNSQLNINWSHNGYATTAYCIWLHEWGTPTNVWKRHYALTSYINIKGLKANTYYDIKVSAIDEVGNHSKYSNVAVVCPTPILQINRYPAPGKGYNDWVNISAITKFYGAVRPSYYQIEKTINGESTYLKVYGLPYSLDVARKTYPSLRIRVVYVIGGRIYASNWSSSTQTYF